MHGYPWVYQFLSVLIIQKFNLIVLQTNSVRYTKFTVLECLIFNLCESN